MTLQEFIKAHDIRINFVEARDTNPNMLHQGESNAGDMDHWEVTLYDGERSSNLIVPFSMGKGHNGAQPDLETVLDRLGSDSAGYENAGSFEEWASEYGYDTDSRRAEATYLAIEDSYNRLIGFLGSDALKELMFEVESL